MFLVERMEVTHCRRGSCFHVCLKRSARLHSQWLPCQMYKSLVRRCHLCIEDVRWSQRFCFTCSLRSLVPCRLNTFISRGRFSRWTISGCGRWLCQKYELLCLHRLHEYDKLVWVISFTNETFLFTLIFMRYWGSHCNVCVSHVHQRFQWHGICLKKSPMPGGQTWIPCEDC